MRKTQINIFSFCLFVVFLYPILPQYIYVVGGINVVNMLLVVFCFVYIFVHGKVYKIRFSENIVWYWLFMIMMALKYFTDDGLLKAVTHVMSFVLLPWFVVSVIYSEKKFIKIIDTLISAGLVLGIIGLLESMLKVNFIQIFAKQDVVFFREIRYGMLRIMTTFGQPIAYGLYQVFIVTLINYRMGAGGKQKYLKFCYVVSILNIFLSVSRIPILAFVIIQILLLYYKSKKKFINYIVVGCVAVLVLGIFGEVFGFRVPLIDDLLQTVEQLLSGNTASTSRTVGVGNRFDLWRWVYVSMGNNWIWGNGASTEFAYKVYEWFTKTSIENQYLSVLWHNGMVGLVMLIFSYASTLHFTWKRRKNYINSNNEEMSFNIAVFILMIVYYIVELGIQETDMARIYGVFIALVIAYNRVIGKTREYQTKNVATIVRE